MTLTRCDHEVKAAAWRHDGALLVSAGYDKKLTFWAIPANRKVLTVCVDEFVESVDWSADGTLVRTSLCCVWRSFICGVFTGRLRLLRPHDSRLQVRPGKRDRSSLRLRRARVSFRIRRRARHDNLLLGAWSTRRWFTPANSRQRCLTRVPLASLSSFHDERKHGERSGASHSRVRLLHKESKEARRVVMEARESPLA